MHSMAIACTHCMYKKHTSYIDEQPKLEDESQRLAQQLYSRGETHQSYSLPGGGERRRGERMLVFAFVAPHRAWELPTQGLDSERANRNTDNYRPP